MPSKIPSLSSSISFSSATPSASVSALTVRSPLFEYTSISHSNEALFSDNLYRFPVKFKGGLVTVNTLVVTPE